MRKGLLIAALFVVTTNLSGYKLFAQKAEAEDGTLTGTYVASTRSGYSGSGYVTGFDSDNDAVTMTLQVEEQGLYDLWISFASPNGEKTNDIYINGEFAGSQVFSLSTAFKESLFGKVFLEEGENKIKILKNWGYFDVDYIRVLPTQPNEIHNYPETLINENATYEANIIYRYLRELYGHRIISGQQSYNGTALETDFLLENTGKLPAIKGFDLIDYSPSRVERGTTSDQTEKAIEWWNQGGIVSMMWHWNAPKGLIDTNDAPWWAGFYTYATTFDFSVAMNDQNSEEYQLLIRDIDAIAEQLNTIQEANVPLLWRPLHEAEGGWFWWGAQGSEACLWLWKLMYDRLTDYHKLNNLIWVWTGTNSPDAMDWYPGNQYVDIIGADIYLDDKNYSPSFTMFDGMAGKHNGSKLLTISETGTLPDPDKLDGRKARWSWFCTWSGDFILDGNINEVSHINEVYNHEYVITLDELPDFYNYESPEFPDEEEQEVLALRQAVTSLSIYPNPTNDRVALVIKDPQNIQVLTLYNFNGQVIKTFRAEAITADMTLDLNDETAGVYVLRVVSRSGNSIFKIKKN